jgi:hypothetical protein
VVREAGVRGFYIYVEGGWERRGLIFFTVEREGVEVNVFCLLHLTCARRRGSGLVFFVKLFFHY